MKKETTNHEILLFANNSFCNRQLNYLKENDTGKKLSPLEELEKACWNGFLFEIFPGMSTGFASKCESFIWHIMSGKNYLCISIGPSLNVMENETAIDPYFFMLSACEN